MEFSIKILVMALAVFVVVLILIALMSQWSGGASGTAGTFFDWMKGSVASGEIPT